MKKCVVIPDSFKGSLSSIEICALARDCILRFYPECEVVTLPVADGGEGTVDCFLTALHCESVSLPVSGPHMEQLEVRYALAGDTAVIEMASASGLPLMGDLPDPAGSTTYGVGEQIVHAVKRGARKLILGLGGSATNDGGCGCAAAVGVRFFDRTGAEFIPTGGTLRNIVSIDVGPARKLLEGVEVVAMCDIDNPMHGPNGAAYIFAPQKGAGPEMVRALDDGLRHLDRVITETLGISVSQLPGAGAAGAFGAGCVAFLGATLASGIETVLDTVEFDRVTRGADMIFTGEGRIDAQSLRGKAVVGIARRAKGVGIPVTAVVGAIGDDASGAYDLGVTAMFSINRLSLPYPESRYRSAGDFVSTLEDILRYTKALRGD